jgi:hypothetical protein
MQGVSVVINVRFTDQPLTNHSRRQSIVGERFEGTSRAASSWHRGKFSVAAGTVSNPHIFC